MKIRPMTLFLPLMGEAAAQDTTSVQLYWYGDGTCGGYIADIRESPPDKIQHQAWMLGFISGHNIGDTDNYVTLPSINAMYLWFENYCTQNPLDSTITAMVKFILELQSRQGNDG